MNKLLIYLILTIIFIIGAVYSDTIYNQLTKGQADNFYCAIANGCGSSSTINTSCMCINGTDGTVDYSKVYYKNETYNQTYIDGLLETQVFFFVKNYTQVGNALGDIGLTQNYNNYDNRNMNITSGTILYYANTSNNVSTNANQICIRYKSALDTYSVGLYEESGYWENYMTLTPSVMFTWSCAEIRDAYDHIVDGKIIMRILGQGSGVPAANRAIYIDAMYVSAGNTLAQGNEVDPVAVPLITNISNSLGQYLQNNTDAKLTNINITGKTFINTLNITGNSQIMGYVGIGVAPYLNGNTGLVVYSADNAAEFITALPTGLQSGRAFGVGVLGESWDRLLMYSSGLIGWGSGSALRDIYLSRQMAGWLKLSGNGNNSAGNLNITGTVFSETALTSRATVTAGSTVTAGTTSSAQYISSFRGSNALTNSYTTTDNTQVIYAPQGGIVWHDVARFAQFAYTVSTDIRNNTEAWKSATTNFDLFNGKELQRIEVINSLNNNKTRWTFSNVGFSGISWVEIGYTHQAISRNVNLTIESSMNTTDWTVQSISSHTLTTAPFFYYVPSLSGHTYLRITMEKTSGNDPITLTTIRLYSARMGDQGLGKERELPYSWNTNKDLNLTNATLVSLRGTGNAYACLDYTGKLYRSATACS